MSAPDPREHSVGPRRPVTVLESVEEIRASARRGATVREAVPSSQEINAPPGSASAPVPAEPYRPVDRPSMAILTVLDDGDDDGEKIRLRGSSFVIGRVEGNLVLPHDAGISGRHAEIQRRVEGGPGRWFLRDLQSTNGTFVRASSVVFAPDQEVLIGRGRFRFEPGVRPEELAQATTGPVNATRKWSPGQVHDVATNPPPSLVELTPHGEGRRFRLAGDEVWVGRDSKRCAVVLDDPTVDPRHARAYRDSKGRWVMENARSLNGLWVRIHEVALDHGGQFLCGEQRFAIKILSPG